MKYYSDKTKKIYDTVEQLQAAEKKYDDAHAAEIKKAEERKRRADEIAAARKDLQNAQKKYNELVNKFIKDYGSYHATYNGEDVSAMDVFYRLFDLV